MPAVFESPATRRIGGRHSLPYGFARCSAAISVGRRRSTHERVHRSLERIADTGLLEPGESPASVLFAELESEAAAAEFFGDDQRRRAASKRVDDELPFLGAGADDASQELLRHLAAMKAGPLLERPRHSREIPRVLPLGEAVAQVLWTQDPRVVGQSPAGISPRVGIHELPGRGNAVLRVVLPKGETFRILDEVEQMGMRAAELMRAIDAERVIPDDPTAAMKADLLTLQLQLGGEFIADRQPERARRLQPRWTGSIQLRHQSR